MSTGTKDSLRVERPAALHYSQGKSGVEQIPVQVLMEWGDVFTYGEKKYARDNWKGGTDWHQFYGSALRHLYKFWAGEDFDNCDGVGDRCTPDADFCPVHSRLSHLAQAIWNIGALRYYQLNGLGSDSRDKPRPQLPEETQFLREFASEMNKLPIEEISVKINPEGTAYVREEK